MNILKLKKQVVVLPIILSVVYGVMVIYITSYFITLNKLVDQDSFSSVLRWIVLFIDFMMIASIWFFVVRAQAMWNYRIIFTGDNVGENKKLTPFVPRKEILYSQVKSVSYDWPGLIVISSMDDTKFKINMKTIDGGKARVLETLKTYLPNGVMDDHLSQKIERSRLYEKKYTVGGFIISAIYLIVVFAHELFSIFPVGWNVYGHWGARDVAGFLVESRDSVWAVTRNFGGSAEVIHYGEDVIHWKLPDPETLIDYSNVIILPDVQGLPTVINREGEIYIWTLEGKWKQGSFPAGYTPWIFGDHYASFQTDAWFILHKANDDNVLAQVHGGSNKIEMIQLPEYAREKEYEPYQLSILSDGTVLVLAGKHESAVFILKNGEWQDRIYPANSHSSMIVQDFTMDAKGRFYFLHTGFHEDKNIVEMIDAGVMWETQLPSLEDDFRYEHLEVDRNGRFWIDGRYESQVTVLKPVWGGFAEEIVSYTEGNSSFSGDSDVGLRLLSNGQIWSADRRLVWIDSNLDKLPQPLPTWVNIVESRGYHFIIYLSFILFLFLWSLYMKSISKKYYNN